jgi:hypothetical protein
MASDVTSIDDLKARLALLKQHGATYYKDGMLELHLTNRDAVKAKPKIEDKDTDLGPV